MSRPHPGLRPLRATTEHMAILTTLLYILFCFSAFVLIVSWWVHRRGLKGMILLFVFLTVLPAAQWAYSFIDLQLRLATDDWFEARRATNDGIVFVRHPNVYYLLAESYSSSAQGFRRGVRSLDSLLRAPA